MGKNKLLLAVVAVVMLMGCKTKYVAVPEVHTEYITKNSVDIVRDTLYHRDSIYHYVNGDTVYMYKETIKYHPVEKIIEKCDTVLKTDTITKIVQETSTKTSGRSLETWMLYVTLIIIILMLCKDKIKNLLDKWRK